MSALHGGTTILGLAAVLPAGTLEHEEMVRRFGEQEAATVLKMSGIRTRRVAAAGQQASDLALTAAERLIRHKGFDRSRIDLLMFVSTMPDYRSPATACVLHSKLGLQKECAAFDVNQACSAYPYALAIAHSMISAEVCSHALVLNAEIMTRLTHPLDRGLAMLHSDGAVATILGPCEDGAGFAGFSLGTDGTGARHSLVPAGGFRMPCGPETRVERTDASGCVRTDEHLAMDGPAVFHFSVYKVPAMIKAVLGKLGLTIDDIDHVLLHQASQTLLDLIYNSLRVPEGKRFSCLERMGNSGGPSVAVALAEAWRLGRIRPGTRTLLCSFGTGLSWGGAVIRWPPEANPVPDLDPVVADEEILSAAL